jgi:hypothetical protein
MNKIGEKSIRGVRAKGDDPLDCPALQLLPHLSYIYTFLFRLVYFSALNMVSEGALPKLGVVLPNYTARYTTRL